MHWVNVFFGWPAGGVWSNLLASALTTLGVYLRAAAKLRQSRAEDRAATAAALAAHRALITAQLAAHRKNVATQLAAHHQAVLAAVTDTKEP